MKICNLLLLLSVCLLPLHAQKKEALPELRIAHTEAGTNACMPGLSQLSLRATLRNPTPDTLRFWLMNCSVSDNFCTDNPDVSLCTEFCFKNAPRLYQLAPAETLSLDLGLYLPDGGKKYTFRIGYYHVSRSESAFGELRTLLEQRKKDKVKPLWSNRLTSIL
ncbi:MAG: hypothetical protein IBJ09_07790 [Bacteroidia bacterium]|nr:hypothetical protein [Bacteroidia bacterium]